MTSAVIAVALTLVAVTATVVVLTPDPAAQAASLSLYVLVLAVLFFVLQAPDVALAEVTVGTAVVPLMVLLALRRIRRDL
jgi:energy-converting hydrogenase B subunit D